MSTVGCRGVLCVGRDNQHQMAQAPPLNTSFLYANVLRLGGFTPLSSLKFLLQSKFPAVSRTHILLIYSLFCLGSFFSLLLPAPTPFYHLLCEGISCTSHVSRPSIHFLILKAEVTMMPREQGGSSEQARFWRNTLERNSNPEGLREPRTLHRSGSFHFLLPALLYSWAIRLCIVARCKSVLHSMPGLFKNKASCDPPTVVFYFLPAQIKHFRSFPLFPMQNKASSWSIGYSWSGSFFYSWPMLHRVPSSSVRPSACALLSA